MVSRVYTPVVMPYARTPGAKNGRGGVPGATDEEQSPFRAPQQQSDVQAEQQDPQRPSAGLQSVQFDRQQKIPLSAVLSDFTSTMEALGADEQTRLEVATYLQAASLQATRKQPEVPFIKHSLRTAAGTLDQFIANALGQPSQVVKEWVDALLLQEIDFHTDTPYTVPANTPSAPEAAQATTASPAESTPDTTAAGAVAKARIKALVEQAKQAHQAGNTPDAEACLQAALDLLGEQSPPDWAGKIWHLRGKFCDQAGDWGGAVSAFEQAAQQFEAAGLPTRQARALHIAAAILEERGDLQAARRHFEQVVALETQGGQIDSLIYALNDLGSVQLRQGETATALTTLAQAVQGFAKADLPAAAQSDILSNLGAAHRRNQDLPAALSTYQHALSAAKAALDKTRYSQALQQLAALYVEANQPAQAMKALQQLEKLRPQKPAQHP